MDIAKAGEQIRGAVEAYLLKDPAGAYEIPSAHQRPIILMGPPGVGKTAIVAQVASELGINFVSYSITHHTRQTALGLPFISTKAYDGKEVSVTEYTMSEIIAAVHDAREATGVGEGILFLDEVNCVSETLAPAMMQFLQFKTFGQHRLPDGWTIVAAGNPPEYNRSAREFDPALLDRMKRIDVEPDLAVWLAYAASHGVHPAIMAYLEAKPADFYNVRAGVRGTRMVTARGWEDLSRIVKAYERLGRAVDSELVRQYLQDDAVSSDFAAYYSLFAAYGGAYRISGILRGEPCEEAAARLKEAPFDERAAVVGLMADALVQLVRDAAAEEEALRLVRSDLLPLKPRAVASDDPLGVIDGLVEAAGNDAVTRMAWSPSKPAKRAVMARRELVLKGLRDHAAREMARLRAQGAQAAPGGAEAVEPGSGARAFEALKGCFNGLCDECMEKVSAARTATETAFAFIDGAVGSSDEEFAFRSRLSSDPVFVCFAGEHGGSRFLRGSEEMLVDRRNALLLDEIALALE